MIRRSHRAPLVRVACCIAVLLTCAAAGAGLPTSELLQRLPPGITAIAVIDVEALLKSKLAEQEKWRSKQDVAYGSRPLMVPPEAKTVVVAAQLDPTNDLSSQWQVSLVDLATPFTIDEIAKTEGGRVEPFGDLPAAWTPTDAYVIQFDPGLLAMAQPANRQAISRWIKFAQNNKQVAVSDYLQAAMGRLTNTSQFVLAIDLADVPQRQRVEQRLAASQTVGGKEDKVKQLADLITGVQGLTVTVGVTDKIMAEVRIDFSADVRPLGNLAKPLLIEVLDKHDLHLSDLEGFTAELLSKSVVLRGPLSIDGLRRLGSLLEMSSTKFSDLKDAKPTDSQTVIKDATLAYYHSIDKLIEDLRHTLEDTRDNHAVWMERYGRKVDALPILNVDQDLVAWGAKVGVSFREMGLAKRGAGIRGGVRKSGIYGGYSYGFNGYGFYGAYQPEELQMNQINRQEEAQAKAVRYNTWKELEDTRADIRKQMTLKYNVEF